MTIFQLEACCQKDKTVIGIETDLWLYKDNDLDALINLGGQLIDNMTNACT